MLRHRHIVVVSALTMVLAVSACGGGNFMSRLTGGAATPQERDANVAKNAELERAFGKPSTGSSFFDLFRPGTDPSVTVKVNKYIWNASLDVLNFLPVQSIDPFTGVIVTGYGTPPGGGRSYRATIYVQDPALDARSLKLSLQGSGGASVAPETVRAVEDAILNRARQLRIADAGL